MAGELFGLLAGNMMNDRGRAQQIQDQLIAQKTAQQALDNQYKQDLMKRQSPTLSEEASQLSELATNNPSALEALLRVKGRDTNAEMESQNAIRNAQAGYYNTRGPIDLLEIHNKMSGAKLPASQAMDLGDVKTGIGSIGNVVNTIQEKSKGLGPIIGKLRSFNPWDADIQTIRGQVDLLRQVVGKSFEGGVLRKEDEEKYKRILAEVDNNPLSAVNKLINVQDELEKKYNNYLDSLGSAGYNVKNFQKFTPKKSIPTSAAKISSPSKSTSIPTSNGSDYTKLSDEEIKKQLGIP